MAGSAPSYDASPMSRRRFVRKGLSMGGLILASTLFPFIGSCATRNCRSEESVIRMPNQPVDLNTIATLKPHHGNGCFISPFNGGQDRSFLRVFKWKFFAKNHFRDQYAKEEVRPVSFDWQPVKAHGGLSVTFLNHASVLIKEGDSSLLVDPVFNGLSFFIKDYTPLNLDLKQMPRPDHVLITHGHYDHLDLPTLKSMDKGTHFITPLGYKGPIRDELAPRHLTQLDWMEAVDRDGWRITFLPCDHWTMRNPITGPNRSLWGSFLIRSAKGRTIYVSGDTAYFDGFRAIGRMADIDVAIINVGAYEPRWFMKQSHMNPAETVRAFQELGARQLIVVHWGTFRLGDEPVFLPPIQVKEELARVGLTDRLIDLKHGQTAFI